MATPFTLTVPGGEDLTIGRPAPPHVLQVLGDDGPILTIHTDGRVVLDQPDKADEAAHRFAAVLTQILRGDRITGIRSEEDQHADQP